MKDSHQPRSLIIFEQKKVWLTLLFAIVLTYLIGTSFFINQPFIRNNEDDNIVFGFGAYNLSKFGFFELKFGDATIYAEKITDIKPLNYYTHHPQFFIVPTALAYKFFGTSELTTRLPSVLFSIVSILAFYWSIFLWYKKHSLALLSTFFYALFPGLIFYTSSLSEKVYVIAFIQLLFFSYSLFEHYPTKFSKILFIIITVLGGLMGWHFFFAPASLWFYSFLNKRLSQRLFFLINLSVFSLLSFGLNLLHFYILKGPAFFDDLVSIYKARSAHLPLTFYVNRYSYWLTRNFTYLGTIGVFLGFIYCIQNTWRQKNMSFYFTFALPALLSILFFQQWTTHAFGPLYWAPFSALSLGLFASWLLEHRSIIYKLLLVVISAIFIGLAVKEFLFHYHSRILGDKDLQIIRELAPQIPSNQKICIGNDFIGFAYGGIIEWYMHRKINSCNEKGSNILLLFNPNMGSQYLDYANRTLLKTDKFIGCGQFLCVFQRI